MTAFEEVYHRLITLDPALRQEWLLRRQPADVSPAHWWYALIDAAVTDVRRQDGESPGTRPRADPTLAASVVDWALERGFPVEIAVEKLAELVSIALDAGQTVDDLPLSARPDTIARRALDGFAMSRQDAIARAASLRAKPLTEEDLYQPGEDWAIFQAITRTDDYRDYHRLLDIDRMLTHLAPFIDFISDPDLAAELRAWLGVQSDLDPVPTVIMLTGRSTATDPGPPD